MKKPSLNELKESNPIFFSESFMKCYEAVGAKYEVRTNFKAGYNLHVTHRFGCTVYRINEHDMSLKHIEYPKGDALDEGVKGMKRSSYFSSWDTAKTPIRLHNFLKLIGWSQVRLAAELRVTDVTVSRWMNGLHTPDGRSIEALENLYRKRFEF